MGGRGSGKGDWGKGKEVGKVITCRWKRRLRGRERKLEKETTWKGKKVEKEVMEGNMVGKETICKGKEAGKEISGRSSRWE